MAVFHIPYPRNYQNHDTESRVEIPHRNQHAHPLPQQRNVENRGPEPASNYNANETRSPRPIQPARTTQASASAITSASTAITRYSCPPLVSSHQRLLHLQQPPRPIAHWPHRQSEASPISRYSPVHPYRHQHPTKGVIEESLQLVRSVNTGKSLTSEVYNLSDLYQEVHVRYRRFFEFTPVQRFRCYVRLPNPYPSVDCRPYCTRQPVTLPQRGDRPRDNIMSYF